MSDDVWSTRRISVRFPLARAIDPKQLVVMFHDWIRRHRLFGEPLVDVSSYAHVKDGPGVLLLAKDGHWAVDVDRSGAGVSFARKRGGPSEPEARIADAFRRALAAAALLEEHTGVAADSARPAIQIDDRLVAPWGPETFARAEPLARRVVERLYGGPAKLTLGSVSARPFTLACALDAVPTAELLTRLDKVAIG